MPVTERDFIEVQAMARARGLTARFIHPLCLIISTPEYEAGNEFLQSFEEPPGSTAELFSGDGGEGRRGGQGPEQGAQQ